MMTADDKQSDSLQTFDAAAPSFPIDIPNPPVTPALAVGTITSPPKLKNQVSTPEISSRTQPSSISSTKTSPLNVMGLRLPPHAAYAADQSNVPLSPCTPMIDQIRLNNYAFPSIDYYKSGSYSSPSKISVNSPLRAALSLDQLPLDEESDLTQTTVIKYGLPSPANSNLILPKMLKNSSRLYTKISRPKRSPIASAALDIDTPPLTPPHGSNNTLDESLPSNQGFHVKSINPDVDSALGLQLFSPPTPKLQDINLPGIIPTLTTATPTKSATHLTNHSMHPSIQKYYTLGDELGFGGFGFVVAAKYNNPDAEDVPSHGWAKDPILGSIPMEAFVLRMINHPGVVKFVDMFEDRVFWCLVMELHGSAWSTTVTVPDEKIIIQSDRHMLLKHGLSRSKAQPQGRRESLPSLSIPSPMVRRSSMDLFECIETHERFSESQACYIFAQVVDAVYYLNGLGIVHRDLKDENIVVDQNLKVKLIDFGSAILYDPRKEPPYCTKFYGTITFAASEILQGQAYQAPKAEVWSLGCLLSILVCGEAPFTDPARAINGQISRPKVALSQECWDLMLRCLEVEQGRRASIQEIKDHPWILKAAGLKLYS